MRIKLLSGILTETRQKMQNCENNNTNKERMRAKREIVIKNVKERIIAKFVVNLM